MRKGTAVICSSPDEHGRLIPVLAQRLLEAAGLAWTRLDWQGVDVPCNAQAHSALALREKELPAPSGFALWSHAFCWHRARARWKHAAVDCARQARRLSALEPAVADLEQLLRQEPEDWPEPHQLVRASLMVAEDEGARLFLGQCAYAAGQLQLAEQSFVALLLRDPAAAVHWRACAGLAAVHEGRGSDRLALAACLAGAAQPAAGPEVAMHALYLALCLEEPRPAREQAQHLEHWQRRDAQRVELAVLRLCRRARHLRGSGAREFAPAMCALEREWLARPQSPAGRLCQALKA